MKTLTTCGAILLNESKQLLIVRRSDTDEHRPQQWDLPGGHVEAGETFTAALKRELLEETGQEIDESDMELVYGMSGTFPGVNVTWLFFLTHTSKTKIRLSYEHNDYKWVSLVDALAMVEYPPKQAALKHIRDNGLLDG